MSQGIKVVLFDLGNVLIDLDYAFAVKRISHFCQVKEKDIVSILMRSDITALFEEGKLTPEEFFSRIQKLLGLNISYEAFVSIWNEVFFLSAKNRFTFSIANSLKRNYRIAILSNINKLHYDYINYNFPLFGIFDNVFASFKMGAIKPKASIYNEAIKELNALPDEIFYTDDREELVESANNLGINGFVFKGVDKLRQDLINVGVLLS